MGRLEWLENFVEGHNFMWLAFFTNDHPNWIGKKPDVRKPGFKVEDWPLFKADATGWKHPANGCQAFCVKKSWIPEWCDRMLQLHRPYGMDMWFFSLDHSPDEECKFPSRSLGGQQPGDSNSFGHWAYNCGLIEATPAIDSIYVRHFGLWELRNRRQKLWSNHLQRLKAGGFQHENSPSYRFWKLHGADLEGQMDTINLSQQERAVQVRRRSRSLSRRRKAFEMEKRPQTEGGRLAEGQRSANDWAARQEAQTASASSSGAAASRCRLLPWHEVPGGSVRVILQDVEQNRGALPERAMLVGPMPPRPTRPPPSAQAPDLGLRTMHELRTMEYRGRASSAIP
jgi:hypothetical protein